MNLKFHRDCQNLIRQGAGRSLYNIQARSVTQHGKELTIIRRTTTFFPINYAKIGIVYQYNPAIFACFYEKIIVALKLKIHKDRF